MNRVFDIIIVGAGPAGSITAYCLGNSGYTVAVIDKMQFPREKICGDGLTLDVINQLNAISPLLGKSFQDFQRKLSCSGAEIFSPDSRKITLPVHPAENQKQMFTCKRMDFDYFLVRQLKQFSNITLFEQCIPQNIIQSNENILVETNMGRVEGKILVGADGVNSFVARQMKVQRITKEHQCVALRTYYRGVKPINSGNPIEMYLPKKILPGYIWIFHLEDGTANVGIGILASVINKKGIHLNKIFEELLQEEPLKSRLECATRIDRVKGLVIPLGGKERMISGGRFLLAGDAASLVDPVTGEGVANAIRSGRIAASHIIRCFELNSFSAGFNKEYDSEIYRRMMPEFRLHLTLRKLLKYPYLINHIIGAAASYPEIEGSLYQIMWNLDGSNQLKKLRILFKIAYIFTLKYLGLSIRSRFKSTD